MYIYVRLEGSRLFRIFGPASPGECHAWMMRNRIKPREIKFSEKKLLTDIHEPECLLPIE